MHGNDFSQSEKIDNVKGHEKKILHQIKNETKINKEDLYICHKLLLDTSNKLTAPN